MPASPNKGASTSPPPPTLPTLRGPEEFMKSPDQKSLDDAVPPGASQSQLSAGRALGGMVTQMTDLLSGMDPISGGIVKGMLESYLGISFPDEYAIQSRELSMRSQIMNAESALAKSKVDGVIGLLIDGGYAERGIEKDPDRLKELAANIGMPITEVELRQSGVAGLSLSVSPVAAERAELSAAVSGQTDTLANMQFLQESLQPGHPLYESREALAESMGEAHDVNITPSTGLFGIFENISDIDEDKGSVVFRNMMTAYMNEHGVVGSDVALKSFLMSDYGPYLSKQLSGLPQRNGKLIVGNDVAGITPVAQVVLVDTLMEAGNQAGMDISEVFTLLGLPYSGVDIPRFMAARAGLAGAMRQEGDVSVAGTAIRDSASLVAFLGSSEVMEAERELEEQQRMR